MSTKKDIKKGGCPKKGAELKKTVPCTIRFTPSEYKLILDKVHKYGGTFSGFARKALLSSTVISQTPTDVIKVLSNYEMILRNTGTNLNIIAKKANEIDLKSGDEDINKAVDESKSLLEIITGIKNELIQK